MLKQLWFRGCCAKRRAHDYKSEEVSVIPAAKRRRQIELAASDPELKEDPAAKLADVQRHVATEPAPEESPLAKFATALPTLPAAAATAPQESKENIAAKPTSVVEPPGGPEPAPEESPVAKLANVVETPIMEAIPSLRLDHVADDVPADMVDEPASEASHVTERFEAAHVAVAEEPAPGESPLRSPLENVFPVVEAAQLEALSGSQIIPFGDLSEDVHESALLCLWGNEAAIAMTSAAPIFRTLLAEEKLWKQFVCQEFPTHPNEHDMSSRDLYRVLHKRQRCKTLKWKKLPCTHRLGQREGSPGMFARHGHLFVFGGWGHGPESDLHVGRLELPMTLSEVHIQGNPPPRTYEQKVTVLDDDAGIPGRQAGSSEEAMEEQADVAEQNVEEHVVRVLVTGGYKYGGYHGESDRYGVLKIHMLPGAMPQAAWEHSGQMPCKLSNHSATFVPARVAGPSFPDGYLLIFGGNDDGDVTNGLHVLDIATFKWVDIFVQPGSPEPSPRNSHSATLLQVPFLGDAILVVGGGTGCSGNGGPPRGGRDLTDSWWLSGLTGAGPFRWTRAPQGDGNPIAAGRGHVACRLDGTGTVLTVGGGLPPRNMCVAFDLAKGGLTFGGESHVAESVTAASPQPRAFGGGCSLPGGSVLIYGGWHPAMGTFGDLWLGHADGAETQLFKDLPETTQASQHREEDYEIGGLRELLMMNPGIYARSLPRDWQDVIQDDSDDDDDDDEIGNDENENDSDLEGVAAGGSDAEDEDFESDDDEAVRR